MRRYCDNDDGTNTEFGATDLTRRLATAAVDTDDFADVDKGDDESAWNDGSEGSSAPRRISARSAPKTSRDAMLATLVEEGDGLGEMNFETTYKPSRHEAGWLLSSLKQFYDDKLICDVQAQVKGGKEANVYRCRATNGFETELVAAKVYRPRKFRNLRNDRLYREGRDIITADGRPVKNSDTRVMKALNKKSDFGVQVQHTSWLMYEFTTLQNLHANGANVPKPYAAAENALLMGYVGDENGAAPTLIEVALEMGEAQRLYHDVLRNIEILLAQGVIHGDLSAYNILYWNGEITLIDFPQVVGVLQNPHARDIFGRDVQRVCDYFARCGVALNPDRTATNLWRKYVGE